ncbi:GTP pyrophosphokinase [Lactobacillus mulieris]|uniref:GTP pyrophosphokinase family protein n=1 Tax=Lactobacillus mulieris TaxID=2508708 RepID=A0AAW5WXJ6_9LACO|nr:GTP pyrophosphokinase family protein [Lactobacillus mulieris]MCZ3621768.1 GTP pyrophosphokinase family protein [Lactobacillus mulieris]MCZ3623465.1 GTP pyrophosphokinase family protein [Lactobacillus mulieris]MCZ3635775.1 GTP pyrophosphokinase family protein [Lactobacillus mulieris]MCZ3690509.1 GTP pyrophosphokinase family protein [Lactobacillus mulieris]MCZ3696435.1 GTP pyrophosphokinase family protein [Lactobacillus mulieris]
MSIYGKYQAYLPLILEDMRQEITAMNEEYQKKHGQKLYEHFEGRVKSEKSMIEKCQRKQLPLTPESALIKNRDSIGVRIVTNFVDDIYTVIKLLELKKDIHIVKKKDYIKNAKPNGYRSYHLIIEKEVPFEDIKGQKPGHYFIEIQLRTIAMDTWASLEHEIKYKHNIKNPERISKELKRVADELASCDLSMQTIRQLIKEDES